VKDNAGSFGRKSLKNILYFPEQGMNGAIKLTD
jgi:hypothetical protein